MPKEREDMGYILSECRGKTVWRLNRERGGGKEREGKGGGDIGERLTCK